MIVIAFLLFVLSACAGTDIQKTSDAPGQTAADFTLPDQEGKLWTLSDTLKDYRAVVLAFYPKDDTKE
jgi:cytochrome oxidase Cu insertion factor (SCO1/SenC/PrrC family)